MAIFPARPYSSVTKPVNRHWNTIWIKHRPDSSRHTLSWFYPLPASTIHCLVVQDKWDPIQQPFGQPCVIDTTTGVVTALHGTTEELDPMLHDTAPRRTPCGNMPQLTGYTVEIGLMRTSRALGRPAAFGLGDVSTSLHISVVFVFPDAWKSPCDAFASKSSELV